MLKITKQRIDATDEQVMEEIKHVFEALSKTGTSVTARDIAKNIKAPEVEVIHFITSYHYKAYFLTRRWPEKKTIIIRDIIYECEGKYAPGDIVSYVWRNETRNLKVVSGPFRRHKSTGIWYAIETPVTKYFYPTMIVEESDLQPRQTSWGDGEE